MRTGRTARRHDLDWLRVLSMLTIFLFHCARFFNEEDWHVKNAELSHGMSLFVGVVAQWIMPLFFVLSATSAYHSLTHRTAGAYLYERLQRLIVPLVFGCLVVIAPLQVWIERVSHGGFTGSFWAFYPRYFHGLYGFGGNFAWMGLHLWYLEVLFVFSMITLPLFLCLRSGKTARLSAVSARLGTRPGFVFLLAIPVAIAELLVNLQPSGIGMRRFGGWSLLSYLVFFVLGYLVASDDRLRVAMERHRTVAAAFGVASTTVGALIYETGHAGTFGYVFMHALRACNSWFWLVAILGFGSRHLSFRNELLKRCNEAVLPFYILHQTVIVSIGFFIADANSSVATKFVFLSALSFAVIVALYEVAVRRLRWLRFLFGMKASWA